MILNKSNSFLKKKVVVNSANLHVGGGVQVATSFIYELSRLDINDLSISILSSNEVFENLKDLETDFSVFHDFSVIDVQGLRSLLPSFSRRLANYDLIFTVFGPGYFWCTRGVHLTGFAQPWIICPDNEIYKTLSYFKKFKIRLKFNFQSLFFRRSSKLIVELEHVKQRLIDKRIAVSEDIFVVHNCLSAIYSELNTWKPIKPDFFLVHFSIGFIGRDYPHKNTVILPEIKRYLLSKYGLNVDFFVTLNESEWARKSDHFRTCIRNVGILSIVQCPTFYKKMNAVIFPSLLECFSATPLEALAMEIPLFASDRNFVRDICGEFAWYFDPTSPESAADLISIYINNYVGRDANRLKAAREHALNFSNARLRAANYLGIIRETLDENEV